MKDSESTIELHLETLEKLEELSRKQTELAIKTSTELAKFAEQCKNVGEAIKNSIEVSKELVFLLSMITNGESETKH
jgi:hypothetical protein